MATVQDLLLTKGDALHGVDANLSVLEVTQLMNRHRIGAVVVTDGEHIIGIFTERDVLTRVVAEERLPAATLVGSVMTANVICCEPDTDLDEVSAIMKSQRIRHLPVAQAAGPLLGLVSIGDVNAHYASNQAQTIHFLSDYIYGRV